MSNISDTIEEFLLSNIGEDDNLSISRNELASFFNVAPSQINYVLATRFNFERGFLVESRRGGGGYISITRSSLADNDWLTQIIKENLSDEIGFKDAQYLLIQLCQRDILTEEEATVLNSALSGTALANPMKLENKIRANMLKKILIDKTKKGEKL